MAASQRRWHPRLDNLSLRDQLGVDRLARRLVQVMIGLTGFGLSLAMLLRSGLGGAPWYVFHAALAERLGATVGAMSIAVSFVLLLLWIPLRERLGLATVVHAIALGPIIQIVLPRVLIPVRSVRGREPGPAR